MEAVVVRVKPEVVEVGAHGRNQQQQQAEVNPEFRLQL